MNTLPGYGDERTWPKYNGHPNDPRREAWEGWIDEQAAERADALIKTGSLAALVADYDETALLDNLFDALRYDGDAKKAFDDLLTGLRSTIELRVASNLHLQREEALKAERAERRADDFDGWSA